MDPRFDFTEKDWTERIHNAKVLEKVCSAQDAAALIKSGMTLGCSGFTGTGYPKMIPAAMVEQGQAKNLRIFAGASTGWELDGELSNAGMIDLRAPFLVNPDMRKHVNKGEMKYQDVHLGLWPEQVRSGVWGEIDYAIIECSQVLENGGIVPTLSFGASNVFVEKAKKVILELNLRHPAALKGLHDNFELGAIPNNNFTEIPIESPAARLGLDYIPCDPDKIVAVVVAHDEDQKPRFAEPDEVSNAIANNIIGLLKKEIKAGRLPETITIQSGLGAVANAVLFGLDTDELKPFNMFTEVVQDGALNLILKHRINQASATSISLSVEARKQLYENLEDVRGRLMIRPQEITNGAATATRFGLVAMNTAIECDIYGNVNSTHIMGSQMMNGLGGSADFSRHAKLAIFMTPSLAKGGAISSIVPMVSHVDSTEHDVDIIVTEQGIADLRGTTPKERAELIIENCSNPVYRPYLREYFENAKKVALGQHTPHNLSKALSWHQRYIETGSMLPESQETD